MSMNSRLMMKTRALARVSVVPSITRFDANLETVHRCDHDDRYQGERRRACRDNDDKVHKLWKYISWTNFIEYQRAYVDDSCREDLEAIEHISKMTKRIRTKVPRRSMKTKNRMEKRQNPQSSGRKINSHRLWTVELIQRRRWENKTRVDSGAIVCAIASGVNFVLKVGKCLRSRVVR